MSRKEILGFKSFLNKKSFIEFIALLESAPIKTNTGRESILVFLYTQTFSIEGFSRRPDDFNFYHYSVLDFYNDLLIFCKSQYIIDEASGFGHRTEKLNQEFNESLKKFHSARKAFISNYPQET